jgi:hypothetical protein
MHCDSCLASIKGLVRNARESCLIPTAKWQLRPPIPPTKAKRTASCALADCSPPLASKRAQARPGPLSLSRSWIGRPNAGPHRHIAGAGSDQRLTLTLSLTTGRYRRLHSRVASAHKKQQSVQNCSLARRDMKFGCGSADRRGACHRSTAALS